jgi:hypothetical protein
MQYEDELFSEIIEEESSTVSAGATQVNYKIWKNASQQMLS